MSAQSAANAAYETRKPLLREDATSPLWHLRAAQLLFARGLLRAGDFGSAIADELAGSSDLGAVLIGKGLVRPHDFYQALAEAQELPFVDLLEEPPDPDLLFAEDRANYAALKLVPWRLVDGHWLIATVDTGDPQRRWAERRFGEDFNFVVTSPFDIIWAQRDHFRGYDNLRAREGLLERKPERLAKVTFMKPLKLGYGIAAALNGILSGWIKQRSRRIRG